MNANNIVKILTNVVVNRHLHNDEMSDDYTPYVQTDFDVNDSFERFCEKNNVTLNSLKCATLDELDTFINKWRDWLLADGYIGWDTHS